MDDHSVGNFIQSCNSCETIAGAFQNREAMQKPSDSNDSDSSDAEFGPDHYYVKVFDSSDPELSMTTEIVEGKSHKVIAYKKAIKATENKEQQEEQQE